MTEAAPGMCVCCRKRPRIEDEKRCAVCAALSPKKVRPPRPDGVCRCGKVIPGRKYQGRPKKHCSLKCCHEASLAAQIQRLRAVRGELVCRKCGTRWFANDHRNVYCSEECRRGDAKRLLSERWRREHPLREVACRECGRKLLSNRAGNVLCGDECRRSVHAKLTSGGSHRRARLFGVPSDRVGRMTVFVRDGWKCQICGRQTKPDKRGTLSPLAPVCDHRVPISKGGPDTIDNLQTTCRRCNVKKSNLRDTGQVPLWHAARPVESGTGRTVIALRTPWTHARKIKRRTKKAG